MSTSNVQPQVCSCTRWPPASAKRSICTASGRSHSTRTADRSSTTTTTPWSTSTRPAPVLTPCLWSSGLWAPCTDRGRSVSTQDPATLGRTHRTHLHRPTEIFKVTAVVNNSLQTIFSLLCFYGTILEFLIGVTFFYFRQAAAWSFSIQQDPHGNLSKTESHFVWLVLPQPCWPLLLITEMTSKRSEPDPASHRSIIQGTHDKLIYEMKQTKKKSPLGDRATWVICCNLPSMSTTAWRAI